MATSFEYSPLAREIGRISQESFPIHSDWYAEIKAGEKKHRPLRIISIDVLSDFQNRFADEIVVDLLLGAGTYQHEIYPKKNDLTITLFRKTLGADGKDDSPSKKIERQEFRAIILDTKSDVITEGNPGNASKGQGDINALVNVKIQLLDKAIEQLRAKTCGGVFRESKGSDVLKYLLTDLSKDIQVDVENEIKGVDMAPPANEEAQKHILIPHGTPFLNMPEIIQNSSGGIYGTGFGFYLYRKCWYVYPLYDVTRFEKAKKTLTIINVPSNKMPGRERTYRVTDHQVIAIATGQTIFRDQADIHQLNKGNGTRFTDARSVMENFVKVENNTVTSLRKEKTHEYLLEERKNGLSNAMVAPTRITSNPYAEASRLAQRNGAQLACVWENSDPTLIFPGMPVRYQYLRNGNVHEVYGTVLSAQSFYHGATGSHLNHYLRCNTSLHLFLEANNDWLEEEAEMPA